MATSAERLGTGLEFSDEFSGFGGEGEEELPPGIGPWKLAWRRLRRNKVALFFGGLFLLIVVLCLLAPVYARYVAHTTPQAENITGTIKIGGKAVDIVSPTDIPIAPTWHSQYFLGADGLGRDVAVRLLYGGRNSLQIGADGDAHHDVLRAGPGADRRLLPGGDRRGCQPYAGRDLGLPGRAAGDHARHRARGRRYRSNPRQQPVRCRHSSSGSSTSRTSPSRCAGQVLQTARARVHRRRAATGTQPHADHVLRDHAEPGVDDHRLHPADPRERDPASRRRSPTSASASSPPLRRGAT